MKKKESLWLGFMPYLISATIIMMAVMVASPTLPLIMADYGLSAAELPWQNTLYTLGAAVLAPVLSWFGDVRGMKKSMLLGLTVFALGLGVCGLAPNYVFFCAGSFMRGFATAAVIPATMYYIATHFPKEKSVGAYAMITVAMSLGCAVGPALAGILVDALSWRKVFLLCAAVVVLCLLMVAVGVQKISPVAPDKKLDGAGTVLLLIFFAAFLSALTLASQLGWLSPIVLGLLLTAMITFVLFYSIAMKKGLRYA